MSHSHCYYRNQWQDWFLEQIKRIKRIECQTTTLPPEKANDLGIVQGLAYLHTSTNFIGARGAGSGRVSVSPVTTIDEETNAAVVAYATFDDTGGNGNGTSVGSGMFDVPLLDGEGKTANYHINPLYFAWEPALYPQVANTKQFLAGHTYESNVPGTVAGDQNAYVYYASNAAFNLTSTVSFSLWFYPTDLNQIGAETWRFLAYRWIDASNWFIVALKPADDKVTVFINEGGVQTKLVGSAACVANQWNNIIFTYNGSTNALVIYLNNSSSSSTSADTAPNVYTANSNLYLGGLPTFPAKRYTGYLLNFTFWNIVLTGTQASNMWLHGTIT